MSHSYIDFYNTALDAQGTRKEVANHDGFPYYPHSRTELGHGLREFESETQEENGEVCNDSTPHDWVCTRHPGHPGLHIAHGTDGFILDIWSTSERECDARLRVPEGL